MAKPSYLMGFVDTLTIIIVDGFSHGVPELKEESRNITVLVVSLYLCLRVTADFIHARMRMSIRPA